MKQYCFNLNKSNGLLNNRLMDTYGYGEPQHKIFDATANCHSILGRFYFITKLFERIYEY